MTRSELQQKCLDLISPVTGTQQAEALCAAVWKLETIQDVQTLRPLLCVA
jgi:hypothetical protein